VIERLDATVRGVRMACRVRGAPAAPAMVLLHALGEDARTWDAVAAEFAAAFRVFAVDLRGHGSSDWPGRYGLELMRDDILGLLDHLGLRRVTLVGHSMGGVVAYLIATTAPHRIDRLILEDAPPPTPRSRAIPERPDGPLSFDWAVVPAIVDQVNDPDPAWWEHLTRISAPTLLIAGGPASHIPQDKLRELAARVQTCTLLTIAAGHNIHAARPEEFAAAVLDFVRH
jgi:3-oxoadipate enol-lactonase